MQFTWFVLPASNWDERNSTFFVRFEILRLVGSVDWVWTRDSYIGCLRMKRKYWSGKKYQSVRLKISHFRFNWLSLCTFSVEVSPCNEKRRETHSLCTLPNTVANYTQLSIYTQFYAQLVFQLNLLHPMAPLLAIDWPRDDVDPYFKMFRYCTLEFLSVRQPRYRILSFASSEKCDSLL